METLTTKRVIKSGVTNFFRNIWVSVAATSMVAITLFIISTMIIFYILASLAVQNSTDKIGVITAYFKDQTTSKEMANVKAEVETMPGVKSVTFVSKDEAKQKFKNLHQNQPSLLETLNQFSDAETPIPASISIKTDNLTDYSGIYNSLTSAHFSPYFETVRDSQKV